MTKKITTFAQLKEQKKPVVQKVYVALDNERADEFNNIAIAYREAEAEHQQDPSNAAKKKEFAKAKAAPGKDAAEHVGMAHLKIPWPAAVDVDVGFGQQRRNQFPL